MWLKYNFLGNWVELPPTPYFCLFVPKDTALLKDWCRQQTINYVRNSQKSDLVEYNFLSAWCGSKKKEGFPIMGKQAYATSQLPIRHSNSNLSALNSKSWVFWNLPTSYKAFRFIQLVWYVIPAGTSMQESPIIQLSVLLMQSSFQSFLTFGSCCENLFVQRKNRFSLEYFPKTACENPSHF